MAEAYSGLRRRRKRTHPSKCPCCISDDVEPESEGSAGIEELHDANSKKDVGHKQNKRRKIVKKKDDDYKSDSEVSDHAAVTGKEKKTKLKTTKLRSSCNSSPVNEKETNKDAKNLGKNAGKSWNKNENDNNKNKATKNNNGKKGSGKNSISLKKSTSEDVSDEDISLSSLKAARSKKKGSTSTESEMSGKKKKSKENTKESNKKKSVDIKNKKSKIQEKNELESNTPKNENTKTENGNGRQAGNKNASKGRLKKTSPNAVQTSKSTVTGNSSSKEVIQPKKSKVKNIVLSSKVSQITQVKSVVFDHLFEELKSCLENNNLSVKEAGDMLMKISAEDLHLALRSAGLGDSLKQDRSSKSQNTGFAGRERKAISDNEEIVSQAAEALVSFRSKSPLSKEKENKAENNTLNPVTSEVVTKASTAAHLEQSFGKSQKLNPHVMTTAGLKSTQSVQALMQIQTSSGHSPHMFQTHMTSSPSHNLVQGQGYLAVSLPQQFPQHSSAGINTSFSNMMSMVASHGALPSFSQIAAQLRPPSMQVGVQPTILSAGATNQSVPTSVMLPSPNLMQPQLQPSVPIQNHASTNKLQALAAIKNTGTPIEAPGNKGAPNQKQILPQQPLKGMEEVVGNVGNVGTNVPPIVWSLKSPVVFLGSPQNLGGVPRNLMATSANQGVNVNPNKDQSGYPPVAPRLGSSLDGTRINPGTVSSVPAANVLTLGGRPILPRTQLRSAEDASNKRPQPISAQTGLAFVTQQTSLGSPGMFPVQSTTPSVLDQGALTQVSSALNSTRTGLVAVSLPATSLQINTTIGNLTSQNVHECAGGDCSSPTSVAAKQAVKKLVHERTKTAELKREASASGGSSAKLKTILPSPPKPPETATTTSSTSPSSSEHPDSASKNSEFNLEQAATALLSIGVPDGSDMLKSSSTDSLKEDPDEDVVFTSKGMFRVGDVDVDPHYNRIGREGYTCGKCNKIFTSLSYLARHIKRVCPDMSCRKWKCSMCDKAFRHPFGLQQHVYTHTGERPHKCPICPKAFYSSNDLRRHSRIHSGERPYACKHCDKRFATTISLKTHTYIHTGEKPHKCPQCPKTFATSSKLGRHIVTHSEQRPYSCDQCPKSFNRSGDLRRHNMAVHEGKEKSFECEVCSMSFTKSADLRRHSTTHNTRPPKTMECADCGTQFSTPICLKMHRETYHKTPTTTTTTSTDTEKPSTCDICGKTYSSLALLAKHKAVHEPTSTAGYDASQFQHIAPKPVEQNSDPPSG